MRERIGLKEDKVKLDKDLKICAALQQEKLVNLGRLKSEEEQHNRRIQERDNFLVGLARRFEWPGSMQYKHPLSKRTSLLFPFLFYFKLSLNCEFSLKALTG